MVHLVALAEPVADGLGTLLLAVAEIFRLPRFAHQFLFDRRCLLTHNSS